MRDSDYIKSKLRHMKFMGINAAVNPRTGAAQPDWAKAEAEERQNTHARIMKKRKERENTFHQEDEWLDK